MAVPANRKIELTQRDDYSHTITFTDSAGVVLNYSTYTWEGWIGVQGIHVERFTIDATGAAAGVIVITLTNAQTTRLPRNSRWEIRGTIAAYTTTMIGGEAIVSPKVGP